MKSRSILMLTASAVLISSCATQRVLSPAAQAVQFQRQNSTLLGSCNKLGPISAVGRGTFLVEYAFEDADKNLRIAAAGIGADTVVITNREGDGADYSRVQAVALRCY